MLARKKHLEEHEFYYLKTSEDGPYRCQTFFCRILLKIKNDQPFKNCLYRSLILLSYHLIFNSIFLSTYFLTVRTGYIILSGLD